MSHKLIDFIGLEWHDRCLEFHKTNRYIATESYDQVRQPMYNTPVEHRGRYEQFLAPLLEVLDYRD